MKNFDDDSKFIGIIKVLENLNKIEAPINFEQKIFDRISKGDFEKELSFIDKLFLPSRLLPSAGLAAAIILVFFLTNIFSPSNYDNPLLTNPRVRVDVISANLPTVPSKVKSKTKTSKMNEDFKFTEKVKLKENSNNNNSVSDPNLGIMVTGRPSSTGNYYNGSVLTSVSPNGFINKRGLDYKLIYMQRLQRAQIEQMRKRIEEMLKKSQQ